MEVQKEIATMSDATVFVLLVTTLGALYQWPHLRAVGRRLLKWSAGLVVVQMLVVFILIPILMKRRLLTTQSPLHFAASAGDHARVAELLELQHVRDEIDVGVRVGHGLLKSETSLYGAASEHWEGHTETMAALFMAGANPNTPATFGLGLMGSRTPLHAAASNGHTEAVAELIKAGANPNTPMTFGLGGLLMSMTPLHAAASEGHTEAVAALLKAGANPHTPETLGLGLLGSATPLHAAASKGHTEAVAALLKAGANPNTPATLGLGLFGSLTPLGEATRHGHTETVAALLKAGANPITQ